jgi:hypothetical protein
MNRRFQRFRQDRAALLRLTFLGIVAGFLYKLGGPLLRHWAREEGLKPVSMDLLNSFELTSAIRFIWMPFFCVPLAYRHWKNRLLWLIIALTACIGLVTMLVNVPFNGYGFWTVVFVLTMARNTFDSLVVASQMECVKPESWGLGEQFSLLGYRIGMMSIMSVSLLASDHGTSWRWIYATYGGVLCLFLCVLCFFPGFKALNHVTSMPNATSTDSFGATVMATYRTTVQSLKVWLTTKGAVWTLLFLVFYQVQDGLFHPQKEWFLRDMGVTKSMLATISPLSIGAGIVGGFCAAFVMRRKGHVYTLVAALVMHNLVGAAISITSATGAHPWVFCLLAIAEQMTHAQCQIALYAVQMVVSHGDTGSVSKLTLFAVLSEYGMRLVGLRSGWIQEHCGWTVLTAIGPLCGPMVLWIIARMNRTSPLFYKKA